MRRHFFPIHMCHRAYIQATCPCRQVLCKALRLFCLLRPETRPLEPACFHPFRSPSFQAPRRSKHRHSRSSKDSARRKASPSKKRHLLYNSLRSGLYHGSYRRVRSESSRVRPFLIPHRKAFLQQRSPLNRWKQAPSLLRDLR